MAYYDRQDVLFAQAVVLLGIGILLCGLAVVGYQCFFWLRDGVWTPIEIHTIWQMLSWPEPNFTNFKWVGFEWIGVQKLVVIFLGIPVSVVLILTGPAIALIGWANAYEAERGLAEQEKERQRP